MAKMTNIEHNIIIPMKDNPVLLDKVIQDIQLALKDKLKWLDYAFGRAYKLVEHQDDGGKFIYEIFFTIYIIYKKIKNMSFIFI